MAFHCIHPSGLLFHSCFSAVATLQKSYGGYSEGGQIKTRGPIKEKTSQFLQAFNFAFKKNKNFSFTFQFFGWVCYTGLLPKVHLFFCAPLIFLFYNQQKLALFFSFIRLQKYLANNRQYRKCFAKMSRAHFIGVDFYIGADGAGPTVHHRARALLSVHWAPLSFILLRTVEYLSKRNSR